MDHQRRMALVPLLVLLCYAFVTSASADGPLQQAKHSRRQLWIDPNVRPASTQGWNVIVAMTCNGKFNTVAALYIRATLAKLGFSNDPTKMAFGGNAAVQGWKYVVSYTINVPTAQSQNDAFAAVASITPAAIEASTAAMGTRVDVDTINLSAYRVGDGASQSSSPPPSPPPPSPPVKLASPPNSPKARPPPKKLSPPSSPKPAPTGLVPTALFVQVPVSANINLVTVGAILCPALQASFVAELKRQGIAYTDLNGANGCESVTKSGKTIYYKSAFLISKDSQQALVNVLKKTRSGQSAVLAASHLVCKSRLVLLDVNSGVQKISLSATNTPFLVPGGGCASTAA